MKWSRGERRVIEENTVRDSENWGWKRQPKWRSIAKEGSSLVKIEAA